MSVPVRRSLFVRAGLTMAGITLLAVASMLASVIIAETAKGDAAAINLAGSLRMQSFRIATHLLIEPDSEGGRTDIRREADVFDERLTDPLLTHPLPDDREAPLRKAYRQVRARWRAHMRPLLIGADATSDRARAQYLAQVDAFVSEVNHMVRLFQQQAESRILLLRLIQGIALFMTLGVVFFSMYKLHTDVAPPLRELLNAVNRARHGDFSVRTRYQGPDELGLLSRTFNAMAEDLSRLYASLERRVAQKTGELQRSNRSLQILYDAARRLNRVGIDGEESRQLLKELAVVTGLGPITVCLSNPGSKLAYRQISTLDGAALEQCGAPFGEERPDAENGGGPERRRGLLRIPLQEKDRRYGVLLAENAADSDPEPWQRQLLEAVAEHFATAFSLTRQAEQQRRIALMEERAVIARELHDSLAQSLSYLKIQVSRLQAMLAGDSGKKKMEGVVTELREGLTSAYRQLRELLTTFRLRMNDAGLEAALNETIEEFVDRHGLSIRLDYRLGHLPLTSNEEIHILQIVREALSNTIHHARASRAEVLLHTLADGDVQILVDDDGIGLPDQFERSRHYGIAIMQERANGLRGTARFSRREEGGTRVALTFRPRVGDTVSEASPADHE